MSDATADLVNSVVAPERERVPLWGGDHATPWLIAPGTVGFYVEVERGMGGGGEYLMSQPCDGPDDKGLLWGYGGKTYPGDEYGSRKEYGCGLVRVVAPYVDHTGHLWQGHWLCERIPRGSDEEKALLEKLGYPHLFLKK